MTYDRHNDIYLEFKYIYSYKENINQGDIKKNSISIIYSFSSVANLVKELNKGMNFMIYEIRSEDNLKNQIDEIIIKNEKNKSKREYIIFLFVILAPYSNEKRDVRMTNSLISYPCISKILWFYICFYNFIIKI